MDGIGEITYISFLGYTLPFYFVMTYVVMGLLLLLGIAATKTLSLVPGKIQSIAELVFEFIKDITYSTLGPKDGKIFMPLIFTLFIFILLANWIGIIPNILKIIGTIFGIIELTFGGSNVSFVFNSITSMSLTIADSAWYSILFVPEFEEPTRSVNTCLALGIVVFFVVHGYGIINKGILRYLGDYMDPVPARFPYVLFFFLNPFFYLNVIGAISNVVSHSFRLFGNMFGGYMIIAIVSTLLQFMVIPVGLYAFFGLFSGLVQAFVFTMLAVTYIAQQKK